MSFMRFLISATLASVLALPATAETAAAKGERIAAMADEADNGFGDFIVDGEMTLRTARGATSTRRFNTKTLEQREISTQKSILIFEWPGDIRYTALLTHTISGREDAQWLFLPSVGRVKKITGSGRSGSFVGSEFAYEDMVEQESANFTHVWLGDEACPTGAGTCYKLMRKPRNSSGYSQQIVWIDTSAYRYQAIEYYDRRGQLLKTLKLTGYKKYIGRIWRPSKMEMVNHLTGKSTILNWSDYKFNQGLKASQFTRNALSRLR